MSDIAYNTSVYGSAQTDIRESSQVIADELGGAIVEGALKPGEKLSEAALASRFKVSRGPVREALRRLAERNLVVFSPNAGARVVQHTLADMVHLQEVRESLEAEAAKLSAGRMPDGQKSELRALLETHAVAIAENPRGSYLQSPENRDFHFLIAKGSANPVLIKILCQDLYPQLRICRRQHQKIPGRGERALEEHRRILTAIEEGDGEMAGLLMSRHVAASRKNLAVSR